MTRALFGLLLASSFPSATSQSQAHVELLSTGSFHGEEVRVSRNTDWLGLFPTPSGYKLQPTTLHITPQIDDVLDDENGPPTGKLVSTGTAAEPIFLIRGLPLQHGRNVTTILAVKDGQLLHDSLPLNFANTSYVLTVSNPHPDGDSGLGPGSSLTLTKLGLKQIIIALPKGGNDAAWSIFWAGDLDGDGSLDLFLDLTDHYNVTRRVLLLSSMAKTGELVGTAAEFVTTGC